MAYTNRSMIGAIVASALAFIGIAAVMVFETALDAVYWPVAFIIDAFKWAFRPAPRDPLTYALHTTKADDIRRNAPFRSFFERARGLFGFNDHFHARGIVGT